MANSELQRVEDLSASQPSIHCSGRDRKTSSLWKIPRLLDPFPALILPTPSPPLLTLYIGPSPERGQKEKPMKINVNKHIYFAATTL